jgi:hypothetical protein
VDTTRAGLVRAMRRLRAAAGHPSLRAICDAPQAGGRIARSTLQVALAGRRRAGAELLAAFADVCGTGRAATAALLAARDRILNGPPPQTRPLSPCELIEEAESRRLRNAAVRHWLPDPDLEPDWYDRQSRDEEETARAAMTSWGRRPQRRRTRAVAAAGRTRRPGGPRPARRSGRPHGPDPPGPVAEPPRLAKLVLYLPTSNSVSN